MYCLERIAAIGSSARGPLAGAVAAARLVSGRGPLVGLFESAIKGSLSEVGRARRQDASCPRNPARRPLGAAHVLLR
jgi:hypothetical protein